MPQSGYVDVDNKIHEEDHDHGEEEEERVLSINSDKHQNQEGDKDYIVGDHKEGYPEEGDEEAAEDPGNGGEGVGEGDGLGGIKGGDGEDNGGGGEEGEGEEEDEVEELKGEEEGPLVADLGAVGGVVLELHEEWMGEEGVSQDSEGERKD